MNFLKTMPWVAPEVPSIVISTVPIIKKCGCGQTYTKDEWEKLEFVCVFDVEEDGAQDAELRNCPCGSSIAVYLKNK